MNNKITVKPYPVLDARLLINPAKAADLNLPLQAPVYINFGNQTRSVYINPSENVLYDNILMPQNLIEDMHIPQYPTYEITVDNNNIILGPLIGLLMSEEDAKLNPSFLNKMMVYIRKYSELHGAVVVFALDKVDTSSLLIEGYCYNPIDNSFQKGLFPYPSAIYRTIGLNDTWKEHFHSEIGDKFFNNQYFSKWKMNEWLSVFEDINSHIPYTVMYKSSDDIFDMLGKFKDIYIKPVSGLRGHGIIKASLKNNLYTFKSRVKGSNFVDSFDCIDTADEYIKKSLSDGKHLVQQSIQLLKYNDRVIDFRCVMQKNQSCRWVCNAIIARCGDKGSIVSNISSGGSAYRADDLFKNILRFPPQKCDYLINSMKEFALMVCNKLDDIGINCGTLGLDIGINENNELWLIEINNRDPDPTIALDINDRELYYDLKTNPLFYAKALAGFKINDGYQSQ